MADAHVNGTRLWYDVHGDGDEHLLQIGGAGFAHENFGFVTHLMTPHFKVIEMDLRGYGLSDRPEDCDYSMDLWADDLAALLDEIGIARTHVHGTSMGGMVALAFAGRHPQRVDRLILDCGSAKSDAMARAHWEVWKRLAQAYGMGGEPLALEIATKCLSRSFLDADEGKTVKVIQGVLERNCSVPVFSGACDAMATMDLRPYAASVASPTLVMVGSEDCLTPIDAGPDGAGSSWLAEHIAGASMYVVEGSGHTNLMEQPELSARVVIDFLQGRPVA